MGAQEGGKGSKTLAKYRDVLEKSNPGKPRTAFGLPGFDAQHFTPQFRDSHP